jgi:hypothetical protein
MQLFAAAHHHRTGKDQTCPRAHIRHRLATGHPDISADNIKGAAVIPSLVQTVAHPAHQGIGGLAGDSESRKTDWGKPFNGSGPYVLMTRHRLHALRDTDMARAAPE